MATELVLGVGLLVFPVALLVLTLPGWSERQTTARVVAREAARRVAREGVCDRDGATLLGATMAQNLGLGPADLRVELDCAPGDTLVAGSDVLAEVTVRMPAVQIPGVGVVGEWEWTARHREPVDRYGSPP
ncbi:MAG: hypothetical protein ACHQ52_14325 [Candidatus Eisenbacteria bacterium]